MGDHLNGGSEMVTTPVSPSHSHSHPHPHNGPARPKRSQVSRACQRCRRLQKGCSQVRPCQRCIRVGLEAQCIDGHGDDAHPQQQIQGNGASWSFTQLPTSPESLNSYPLVSSPRQVVSLPTPVIEHCFPRFFSRLHPTIPILSPEYLQVLIAKSELHQDDGEAHCLLAAACAMVLLQVEEPHQKLFEAAGIQQDNVAYGMVLLDEALAAHHHLSRRFVPSLERALIAFFLYACQAGLCRHSQAFFFVREATTLWLLLRINEADELRQSLSSRLFWVLLVSERSHAIRYRRPVTLQITPSSPTLPSEAEFPGLCSLVSLFSPVDTPFIALYNQETAPSPALASFWLKTVETSILNALEQPGPLHETQVANLRITQLWLLVILWQVRLRLGFLVDKSELRTLSYHHPLEIGQELVCVVDELTLDSIRLHGVGLTEKLFDIACAMVDVLSRVPLTESSRARLGLKDEPETYLHNVRRLIRELPGGVEVYTQLLDKHIGATLPSALSDQNGH